MKTDFSNDFVVNFNNSVIDVAAYKTFGKEELEESINKIFYLRNIKDENKFIQINIVENVDLPIKKGVVTKCFLTTQNGEVITDLIELNIFSINEAYKDKENSSRLTKMLKDMGNEKFCDYSNVCAWLNKYLMSEEFEELMKEDLNKK